MTEPLEIPNAKRCVRSSSARWHRTKTARMLKTSYRTLPAKIAAYGLDTDDDEIAEVSAAPNGMAATQH